MLRLMRRRGDDDESARSDPATTAGRADRLDLLAELGPAALIGLLAFLVTVMRTTPVRPFVDVRLEGSDLVALAIAGVVAGLIARQPNGVAGLLLGVASAVAIQLWVLSTWAAVGRESLAPAADVAGGPSATAFIAERPTGEWLAGVGGLLVLAAGVMTVAYLVAVTLLRRRIAPRRSALVVVAAVVGVLVLLVAAAWTPLVTTDDTPRQQATVTGDAPVTIGAAPDQAGVHLVTLERTGTATRDAYLCGPLSDSTLTEVGGTIAEGDLNCLIAIMERPSSAWLVDLVPGRYAWLVIESDWATPDILARYHVAAATPFAVPDTPPFAGTPRTAGEPLLAVLAVVACVAAGLFAAGSVIRLTRRRRGPSGSPGEGGVAAAVFAGVATALVLGWFTMLAGSLAADPF